MFTLVLTVRYDSANSTVSYVGEAAVNSSESAAVWRIKKLETVGTVFAVKYPTGSNSFNYVWANRANYTYE